jgi:hypothetical protein
LLIVAATQMALAQTMHLSPWKGGGFGMFASLDGLPFRAVRIEVSAPNRSEQLAVPPSLTRLADAAATLPSRGSLKRLADGVAVRERRHGRLVERVRVEVWRADYTPSLESVWTIVAGLSVTGNVLSATDDRQPH